MVKRVWAEGEHRYPITFYSMRYVLDVRFIEDVENADKIIREISIQQEAPERSLAARYSGKLLDQVNARFDHVEKHFPKELIELYFNLLELESLIYFTDSDDIKSEVRTKIRDATMQKTAHGLTSRIGGERGPKTKVRLSTYEATHKAEREAFIGLCLNGISKLRLMGVEVKQKNLATECYAEYKDSSSKLSKELKRYELSFKELKEMKIANNSRKK